MPTEENAVQVVAPTAAGILYRSLAGRILLLKRGAGAAAHPGAWGFPAGGIEDGETALVAAVRESLEEVGHAPEASMAVCREGDGFTLFLCDGEPEFFPQLNAEHDGYVWALPDDLPQPLHPAVAEQILAAVVDDDELGDADGSAMDEAALAMKRMELADAWAADKSARIPDLNGWFEVKRNPISKVGIFEYRGKQIPGAPDPDAMYRVYRSAEELSAPECLESLKLIPWIDNHIMLGSEEAGLMPAERKGVQGVTGENISFEDGVIYANLKVFSEAMANAIDNGKTDLSLGYRCRYEWTPGAFEGQAYDVVQRMIRGNHLALVTAGRMGPDVAVLDGADEPNQSTLNEGAAMADETKDEGGSGLTLAQALEAVKQVLPAFKLLQEHASGGAATTTAAAAGADADPDKKVDEDPKQAVAKDSDPDKKVDEDKKGDEKKEGSAMDAALTFKSFAAQIARRDRLAASLSKHVGAFDHAEMTEAEVAAYGIKKLSIKADAGQEAAALAGYLQAAGDPGRRATATTDATAQDAAAPRSFAARFITKKGA